MSSVLAKTALAVLAGFETLDADALVASRAPNCIQTWAPSSCNPPQPRDNAQFAAHVAGLKSVMKGFPVHAKEVFESEKEKRVVVWATSQAMFHDELKDSSFTEEEWDYRGEYIFMFHMDASGEKIEKVFEFLDSKGTERLRKLIARARENRAKLGKTEAEPEWK
ncbi:hypothetical protein NA57DRAFT_73844 [Rhizodiscina lignyota]|uniref:SnoaL-like domain-containing protein n=1 Tax=Rhizodiscina lignyota TaxID=1504668 RepID=A0A9P4IJ34_9PEZI|nr:hypothetical protein NA57DRAFT_73844 [Rhizodiscina lignyota]